jgi:hypothetical protein
VVVNLKTSPFFKNLISAIKKIIKRRLKSFLLSKLLHVGFYFILVIVVGVSILWGLYNIMKPVLRNNVVVSQSEIITRVSKLVTLPQNESPDAIVRVEDADILQKQSDFYRSSGVKEGDYILMYPSVAIIYDLRNNTVIAVKKK